MCAQVQVVQVSPQFQGQLSSKAESKDKDGLRFMTLVLERDVLLLKDLRDVIKLIDQGEVIGILRVETVVHADNAASTVRPQVWRENGNEFLPITGSSDGAPTFDQLWNPFSGIAVLLPARNNKAQGLRQGTLGEGKVSGRQGPVKRLVEAGGKSFVKI